ncbi:MAG: hypothetical protein WBE69_20090, partial [Candidatus Binataceae bacterium]
QNSRGKYSFAGLLEEMTARPSLGVLHQTHTLSLLFLGICLSVGSVALLKTVFESAIWKISVHDI